jgi:hypothetical protein
MTKYKMARKDFTRKWFSLTDEQRTDLLATTDKGDRKSSNLDTSTALVRPKKSEKCSICGGKGFIGPKGEEQLCACDRPKSQPKKSEKDWEDITGESLDHLLTALQPTDGETGYTPKEFKEAKRYLKTYIEAIDNAVHSLDSQIEKIWIMLNKIMLIWNIYLGENYKFKEKNENKNKTI